MADQKKVGLKNLEAPPPLMDVSNDVGVDKEQILLDKISALYAKLEDIRKEKEEVEAQDKSNNHGSRVILASRKLPFVLMGSSEQGWRAEPPPDPFTNQTISSILMARRLRNSVWVGWPGTEVDETEQSELGDFLLKNHEYVPIFIDEKKHSQFYDGFCKQILWPLFHGSTPTTEDMIIAHTFESEFDSYVDDSVFMSGPKLWQKYISVNQSFADAIRDVYVDGDVIWVHDYHLLLLPSQLRTALPHAKIGFFLHVPFPSSELYRIMPYREELLVGVLAADLVGFQTYDFARHFLSACESILLCEVSPSGVEYNGHFTEICICPVGIDPKAVSEVVRSKESLDYLKVMERQFAGKKMMLGIDTLDPTKGLIHKFLGIEELFLQNPHLAETTAFVQIGIATSTSDRRSVHLLESQINSIVTRINTAIRKRTGRLDLVDAIQYLICTPNDTMEQIYGLLCRADVLVVTPIRDGMNTLPFEYIMCRESQNRIATVVLSEFTGCARSLGGAMLVNPWNTKELAQILSQALRPVESFEEKDDDDLSLTRFSRTDPHKSHATMLKYVTDFTSEHWVDRYLSQLELTRTTDVRMDGLIEMNTTMVSDAYSRSTFRLFVFALEGVLCKPVALPDLLEVRSEVKNYLRRLGSVPGNMVVVISPRSAETLENVFGNNMPITLAAEHGMFVKWVAPVSYEQVEAIAQTEACSSSPFQASTLSTQNTFGEASTKIQVGEVGEKTDITDQKVISAKSALEQDEEEEEEEEMEWEQQVTRFIDVSWFKDVSRILNYYTERTPGSMIEVKTSCVTWHYRDSDLGHGAWQAKQCIVSLMELAKTSKKIEVCPGEKLIEVRPSNLYPPSILTIAMEKFNDYAEQWRLDNEQGVEQKESQNNLNQTSAAATTGTETFEQDEKFDKENEGSFFTSDKFQEMEIESRNIVDMVVFFSSGDDLMDEDIFEQMAPPPFDLDEFVRFADMADDIDVDLNDDDDDEEGNQEQNGHDAMVTGEMLHDSSRLDASMGSGVGADLELFDIDDNSSLSSSASSKSLSVPLVARSTSNSSSVSSPHATTASSMFSATPPRKTSTNQPSSSLLSVVLGSPPHTPNSNIMQSNQPSLTNTINNWNETSNTSEELVNGLDNDDGEKGGKGRSDEALTSLPSSFDESSMKGWKSKADRYQTLCSNDQSSGPILLSGGDALSILPLIKKPEDIEPPPPPGSFRLNQLVTNEDLSSLPIQEIVSFPSSGSSNDLASSVKPPNDDMFRKSDMAKPNRGRSSSVDSQEQQEQASSSSHYQHQNTNKFAKHSGPAPYGPSLPSSTPSNQSSYGSSASSTANKKTSGAARKAVAQSLQAAELIAAPFAASSRLHAQNLTSRTEGARVNSGNADTADVIKASKSNTVGVLSAKLNALRRNGSGGGLSSSTSAPSRNTVSEVSVTETSIPGSDPQSIVGGNMKSRSETLSTSNHTGSASPISKIVSTKTFSDYPITYSLLQVIGQVARKDKVPPFSSDYKRNTSLSTGSSNGTLKLSLLQQKCIDFIFDDKNVVIDEVKKHLSNMKTLCYLVPSIELLLRAGHEAKDGVGCVVITPTRELCGHVFALLKDLCIRSFIPLTYCIAMGGGNRKTEASMLVSGASLLVATPGRFLDHLQNTRGFKVTSLHSLIIEDIDRIMETGFDFEVREIMKFLPENKQCLLFAKHSKNKNVEVLIHHILEGNTRPVVYLSDKDVVLENDYDSVDDNNHQYNDNNDLDFDGSDNDEVESSDNIESRDATVKKLFPSSSSHSSGYEPSHHRRHSINSQHSSNNSVSGAMSSQSTVSSGGAGGGGATAGGGSIMRPSVLRRGDILENKKFAPRTDMPPSSMLFQAMRRKYGDQHGKHKPPKTAAECWALIRSEHHAPIEKEPEMDHHISYRDGPFAIQSVDPQIIPQTGGVDSGDNTTTNSANNSLSHSRHTTVSTGNTATATTSASNKAQREKSVQQAVKDLEKNIAQKDGLLQVTREKLKVQSQTLGATQASQSPSPPLADTSSVVTLDSTPPEQQTSNSMQSEPATIPATDENMSAMIEPTPPPVLPMKKSPKFSQKTVKSNIGANSNFLPAVEDVENLTLKKLSTPYTPSLTSHTTTTTSNIKNLKQAATRLPSNTGEPVYSDNHARSNVSNQNGASFSLTNAQPANLSTANDGYGDLNSINNHIEQQTPSSSYGTQEMSSMISPSVSMNRNGGLMSTYDEDPAKRQMLPLDSFGCVIGAQVSQAMYFIKSRDTVISLIGLLVKKAVEEEDQRKEGLLRST